MNRQDPTSKVLENYKRWMGEPSAIHHPPAQHPEVSSNFVVLEYRQPGSYTRYCTAGASYQMIPHSQQRFKSEIGARYEYLMHGSTKTGSLSTTKTVCDLLLMTAVYPFLQTLFFHAGFVLPLGVGKTVTDGSPMEFLYFTMPYKDDPRIYTPPCMGEIETSEFLIQTFWVFPIHRSEALFIRKHGDAAFDELCGKQHIQAEDFMRPALI